jgi:hypothetical protein
MVRIWSLAEGFPCLATLQVADLRGSLKAIVSTGDTLYVGGQSCQVSAYNLAPAHLGASPGSAAAAAATAVAGAEGQQQNGGSGGGGAASGNTLGCGAVQACGGPSSASIRATVGQALPPQAASNPCHSHCGSITALAVCGPYVFSASTDSTIRVWRAGSLEFVKVLRGHRGSVLALYGGPGIVLRWAGGGLCGRSCRLCPFFWECLLQCGSCIGGYRASHCSIGCPALFPALQRRA